MASVSDRNIIYGTVDIDDVQLWTGLSAFSRLSEATAFFNLILGYADLSLQKIAGPFCERLRDRRPGVIRDRKKFSTK